MKNNLNKKVGLIFRSVFVLMLVFLFSNCGFKGEPDGGVYRSVDGGKTFEQKVSVVSVVNEKDKKKKDKEKKTIGNANILSMIFDPLNSQTLYIGTVNWGILRSGNNGETWAPDINQFKEIYAIAINPRNSREIYITANLNGRGKILKTTNGGGKWEEVFTERTEMGRVTALAIDKKNPNIVYAGDSLGGIYRTDNRGRDWENLHWASEGIVKIVLDNVNSDKLYFSTATELFRSDDQGKNFMEIEVEFLDPQDPEGENMLTSSTVYTFIVHPFKEDGLLLSDDYGLVASGDGGKTWRRINTLVKPDQFNSKALAIDPYNDKIIYFSSGKTFYKTMNGGRTWQPVQFDLAREITLIKINPKNTNMIFLGTKGAKSSSFQLWPSE